MGLDTIALSMAAKAAETSRPFGITLTPTSQDFSGEMNANPENVDAAIRQQRRIIFDIPMLSAVADATQFVEVGGKYVAATNITYTDATMGDILIQIVTNPARSTYGTAIFQLTRLT